MAMAKDRSLPMTPAARSPRHVAEINQRFIPPSKPKPTSPSKKRASKDDDLEAARRLLLAAQNEKKTLWQWIGHVYNEFMAFIAALVNGFMEQDLEVQMVLGFMMISGFMSVYNSVAKAVALSKYEPGRAPPAPPTAPDWTVVVSDGAMGYALDQPIIYLLVDFGVATIIGVIVLFWEDIRAWNDRRVLRARSRAMRAQGHETFSSKANRIRKIARVIKSWALAGYDGVPPSPRSRALDIVDPDDDGMMAKRLETSDDVQTEVLRTNDRLEELEIRLKVHQAAGAESSKALAKRLEITRERQKLLTESVERMVGGAPAEKTSDEAEQVVLPSKGGLLDMIGNSSFLKVIKNSANGFISVFMFYMDVASDIAVVVLLYNTGNYEWAILAIFFLVAQYVVVFFRVLPYMINTFGQDSCLTKTFIYLGFPVGVLVFDFLMLLEPFGLLAVLPLPAWLKQFIPACMPCCDQKLPQSLSSTCVHRSLPLILAFGVSR